MTQKKSKHDLRKAADKKRRRAAKKAVAGCEVLIVPDRIAWVTIEAYFGQEAIERTISRVTRIRGLIAQDAGLPMPRICIEPVGWDVASYGMVYACVWPQSISGDVYEWIVRLSIATPLLVDDTVLRQILCHEFAHCFWYLERIFSGIQNGATEFVEPTTDHLTAEESLRSRAEIDSGKLANPGDWFGAWDVQHFMLGEDTQLNQSTDKYVSVWVKNNLPREEPPQSFRINGTLQFPDKIAERASMLAQRDGNEKRD